MEYKKQQCRRLLDCVEQYSLYDLFVYFFADDIPASGKFQNNEKVKMWDERYFVGPEIFGQKSIQTKIEQFKQSLRTSNFSATNLNWVMQCDDLLREFHTFNEEAGESGKWLGGTVTKVCKGWSTSKVKLCLHVEIQIVFAC